MSLLRFAAINPLRIKRIPATHPWLVMVKASSGSRTDDPIQLVSIVNLHRPFILLVKRLSSLILYQQEQWNEITIKLRGADTAKLSGGAAVTQSIIVMKDISRPGTPRRKQKTT